jgi:hypothetical protein
MGTEGIVEKSVRFIVIKRCSREAAVGIVQANARA